MKKGFWDPVSLRCVVGPLDKADAGAMISLHKNLLTREVIRAIYRHTQGSPLRIAKLLPPARLVDIFLKVRHAIAGY